MKQILVKELPVFTISSLIIGLVSWYFLRYPQFSVILWLLVLLYIALFVLRPHTQVPIKVFTNFATGTLVGAIAMELINLSVTAFGDVFGTAVIATGITLAVLISPRLISGSLPVFVVLGTIVYTVAYSLIGQPNDILIILGGFFIACYGVISVVETILRNHAIPRPRSNPPLPSQARNNVRQNNTLSANTDLHFTRQTSYNEDKHYGRQKYRRPKDSNY